jgi:L-arabinokinase
VLPDTQNFIETVRANADFFDAHEEVIITRAPGRLDVMGGVADYSGSLVLQLPIANAAHVAIQKSSMNYIRALSLGKNSEHRDIEFDLDFLAPGGQPLSYSQARIKFNDPDIHWAAYATGIFLVLMREKNVRFDRGARILIKSDVPEGKGVSSSAAIEVAVMKAVASAFNIDLHPQELATLCQKLENLVAGAPCGIMDQMTSACGEENKLLQLICQPDLLQGNFALPENLNVWGIDSGVRHAVTGSDYGTVRTAAFMGYRIIADLAKLNVSDTNVQGKVSVEDSRWGGYLANLEPAEFEEKFQNSIPETMSGSEFLKRYHGTTDSVTTVRPDTLYPIRKATQHPIYENARVYLFASILTYWKEHNDAIRLGTLMFESHQSYSDCGLGSEATDLIAGLVRESLHDGLFGARITGGGSGGTVAVLGRHDAADAIEKVRQKFHERTGYLPVIISGSSPGAVAFNHLRLEKLST